MIGLEDGINDDGEGTKDAEDDVRPSENRAHGLFSSF